MYLEKENMENNMNKYGYVLNAIFENGDKVYLKNVDFSLREELLKRNNLYAMKETKNSLTLHNWLAPWDEIEISKKDYSLDKILLLEEFLKLE